jgi:hypothetical protein
LNILSFSKLSLISLLFSLGFAQPSLADVRYSVKVAKHKGVELVVPASCAKLNNPRAKFFCGWKTGETTGLFVGLYVETFSIRKFERKSRIQKGIILLDPKFAFDMDFLRNFKSGVVLDDYRVKNEPENLWGFTQCYIVDNVSPSQMGANGRFISKTKHCSIVDKSKQTVTVVEMVVASDGPKRPPKAFKKLWKTVFANARFK